jgi:hypothetical protein
LLDDRGELTATSLPFHDIPIDADDSMDASGERANAVSDTGSTCVTAAVLEMSIPVYMRTWPVKIGGIPNF